MKLPKRQAEVVQLMYEGWELIRDTGWGTPHIRIEKDKYEIIDGKTYLTIEDEKKVSQDTITALEKKNIIVSHPDPEHYLSRTFWTLVGKNPFPTKTQSTRTIKGNKYWYAGRTQYYTKARLELQILVEQGIGGAVTKQEGWYLLWTRKPVWVDLS